MDNQSTHVKAIREAADEVSRSDWLSPLMICDYLLKMQLGHFSRSYLDTVLQKWRDSPYDAYTLWMSPLAYPSCERAKAERTNSPLQS